MTQMLNFNNYFLTETDNTTAVATYMRANPYTIAHEGLANKVQELAKDLDANHHVILSHSTDNDKNPLTPEQKLRHARIANPGVNFSTSTEDAPSLLHQLSKLHAKGVRNLHLVFGGDRLKPGGFADTIRKYNGVEGKHGYYNFDNLEFHSAGERDPDAEGIEGVSGTKQRMHAMNNDFDSFRAGAPSRMNDDQVRSLMNDVRNGIMIPKLKPETAAKPKPKKLKEETTSAGDAVRGFGDVSGNPAVDEDPLQQYITTNMLAKDKENGALLKMMRQSQSGLLGFKEFNPMSRDIALQYYKDDENADPLLRDKMRNRGKDNNVTRG